MATNNENAATPNWLVRVLIGRNPRRTLLRIVVLVVVSYIVFGYLLLPIRVIGPSMLPTYRERSVNLVNRLAYLFHEPQRGDVVAIKLAGKHVMYLKRIVGLPGETVGFRRGRLLVNGEVVEEPYVKSGCHWDEPPLQVGPGEYYVVGDNRSMDFYLHEQGRAERSRIVGKPML